MQPLLVKRRAVDKKLKEYAMVESNQRVLITKRMLKEGLMRLLNDKSLDKISITKLCRESGINRTTFYRHYEWPRDVLMEMQNDFIAETFDHFQKPMTVSDVERFFTCLADHVDLVKLFFIQLLYGLDAAFYLDIHQFPHQTNDEGVSGFRRNSC